MQQQYLFPDEQDKSLLTAFEWWEKRRLVSNIVVGTSGLVVIFKAPFFDLYALIGVIFYGLIANIFYYTGFLIEVGARYYFKSDIDFAERRYTLFWIGLVFSVLFTLGAGFYFASMLVPID